jgi:hypothetical protein
VIALLLLAAAPDNVSVDAVVHLVERTVAEDRQGYAALAPNLQWKMGPELALDASFEDFQAIVGGCKSLQFSDVTREGEQGVHTVVAAGNCMADEGPRPLRIEFEVNEGKVQSFFPQVAD